MWIKWNNYKNQFKAELALVQDLANIKVPRIILN